MAVCTTVRIIKRAKYVTTCWTNIFIRTSMDEADLQRPTYTFKRIGLVKTVDIQQMLHCQMDLAI